MQVPTAAATAAPMHVSTTESTAAPTHVPTPAETAASISSPCASWSLINSHEAEFPCLFSSMTSSSVIFAGVAPTLAQSYEDALAAPEDC